MSGEEGYNTELTADSVYSILSQEIQFASLLFAQVFQ